MLEWFNPECPFVKKHYGSGNMQKLQEEFTGKGVVWLSVDSSAPGSEGNLTAEQAEKKIAEWKMNQTALVLDPDGKAGRAYGAKNTPHMFVINPEGKVIYEGAIDSKATPNPADIASSTNYVKVALDEAMGGKAVSQREHEAVRLLGEEQKFAGAAELNPHRSLGSSRSQTRLTTGANRFAVMRNGSIP